MPTPEGKTLQALTLLELIDEYTMRITQVLGAAQADIPETRRVELVVGTGDVRREIVRRLGLVDQFMGTEATKIKKILGGTG